MKDLWHYNAQIYICIEYTSMSINISDIMHIVQFEILGFIALPKLLQRLHQVEKNKSCTTIAMVFIHPS